MSYFEIDYDGVDYTVQKITELKKILRKDCGMSTAEIKSTLKSIQQRTSDARQSDRQFFSENHPYNRYNFVFRCTNDLGEIKNCKVVHTQAYQKLCNKTKPKGPPKIQTKDILIYKLNEGVDLSDHEELTAEKISEKVKSSKKVVQPEEEEEDEDEVLYEDSD